MIKLSCRGYGISFGASWGPLEGSWGRLGGLLEAFWVALEAFWELLGGLLAIFWGFGMQNWIGNRFSRFLSSERTVLEASWGRFLGFWRPFWTQFWSFLGDRQNSKQNMQNRRFTSILSTLARKIRIWGRSKTLYFMGFWALGGHFDRIFTVKS